MGKETMNIKDDPVYQDKLRKMHVVRRYLKIREKVYIARRDAGFNVKEADCVLPRAAGVLRG